MLYNKIMSSIDEYLEKASPSQRTVLQEIREFIHKTVPSVTEKISYGIPCFDYKGKYLIYFGAFKDHLSLYPGGSVKVKDKLKDFKLRKGTIQFTPEKPIPQNVLKQMLLDRVAEISKHP